MSYRDELLALCDQRWVEFNAGAVGVRRFIRVDEVRAILTREDATPTVPDGLPPIADLEALNLTEDERRDLAFRAWVNASTEEDIRWQPHPEPERRAERAARWRQIATALHPEIMGYPNGQTPT